MGRGGCYETGWNRQGRDGQGRAGKGGEGGKGREGSDGKRGAHRTKGWGGGGVAYAKDEQGGMG